MGRKLKKIDNPEVIAEVADIFHDENLALHYQKLTDTLREKLLAVKKDGVLDFSLDPQLRKNLMDRARRANITLEEQIRRLGVDFDQIVTLREAQANNFLTKLRNYISSRISEDGKVYNFSQVASDYYKMLEVYAKKNNVSIATAVNMVMGVPDGTYQLVNARYSIYMLDSANFISNNEKTTKLIIDAIKDCMDKEGYVVKLSVKHVNVMNIIDTIAELNQISIGEVLNIFVPEAKYRAKKWIHLNDEKFKKLIVSFDDGTGCVNSVKKCASMLGYIKQRSQETGMTINEFLQSIGNYNLSWDIKEVDHEDYIVTMLTAYYGENGDVSGITSDHPDLYRRIVHFRNFCPGGALEHVSDVIESLGFSFARSTRKTNSQLLSEEEIGQNIYKMFGENKVIKKLQSEKYQMLAKYSGILGMSVPELLSYYGYEYINGKNINARMTKLYLTEDEYKLYLAFKKSLAKQENARGKHYDEESDHSLNDD